MDINQSQSQQEYTSPLEKSLLKLLMIVFFCAVIGIIIVLFVKIFPSSSPQSTALLTPLSQGTPTPQAIRIITPLYQHKISN